MKAVIQRVKEAGVTIDSELYSNISKGLLILLGIQKGDTEETAKYLARKIVDLRIFPDEGDKMNLNIRDIGGEILVVSQFTLCTDNKKSGNRPSFTEAENPERANVLYEIHTRELKNYYIDKNIKTGLFAGKMDIKLINEGPVTIILER